jgi:hypothetical protein
MAWVTFFVLDIISISHPEIEFSKIWGTVAFIFDMLFVVAGICVLAGILATMITLGVNLQRQAIIPAGYVSVADQVPRPIVYAVTPNPYPPTTPTAPKQQYEPVYAQIGPLPSETERSHQEASSHEQAVIVNVEGQDYFITRDNIVPLT